MVLLRRSCSLFQRGRAASILATMANPDPLEAPSVMVVVFALGYNLPIGRALRPAFSCNSNEVMILEGSAPSSPTGGKENPLGPAVVKRFHWVILNRS